MVMVMVVSSGWWCVKTGAASTWGDHVLDVYFSVPGKYVEDELT